VALALESLGFDDVHPLIGGFDAWMDAGLPIEPK
jgi:rhodanese-related sulfurtransferase